MTIAGVGLAGLSAAVSLREAGIEVSLSDSAAHFGGRCRSYVDPILGTTIDNGNHLVLAGNVAVARFLETIGATSPLTGPDHADFAFVDLNNDERWTLAINDGRLPWWIMSRRRRATGTRATDYLALTRLLSRREQRIDQLVAPSGPLWRRLVEPIFRALLNTAPNASARLGIARATEKVQILPFFEDAPKGQSRLHTMGEDIEFLGRTWHGVGGAERFLPSGFGLVIPNSLTNRLEDRVRHGKTPADRYSERF